MELLSLIVGSFYKRHKMCVVYNAIAKKFDWLAHFLQLLKVLSQPFVGFVRSGLTNLGDALFEYALNTVLFYIFLTILNTGLLCAARHLSASS